MTETIAIPTNAALQTDLRVVTTRDEMREVIAGARSDGKTIGLVPTMGALHEGHLSLVRKAKSECDLTIATIFVNPAQFGEQADLVQYPRTLDADLHSLSTLHVEVVFAPNNSEVYPPNFSTWIEPPDVGKHLEGEHRTGHFRGVATVVLKLFNMTMPDVAYFGEKDYQQLQVIRQMVVDLNLPITIRGCPIVRESDGLAMSSRNVRLDAQRRAQSLALSQSLQLAADLVNQGEADAVRIIEQMRAKIAGAGISQIDYIALADPETLEPVSQVTGPTRVLVAAHVGTTRLIDNRQIG